MAWWSGVPGVPYSASMNLRSLSAAAAAAGLALTLTACGSDDGGDTGGDGAEGSAAGAEELDLVTDGTLTVCSDVPYPPFEDFDESSPSG